MPHAGRKHWLRRYDWDAIACIVAAAVALILHLLHVVQPDILLTVTLVLVALLLLRQLRHEEREERVEDMAGRTKQMIVRLHDDRLKPRTMVLGLDLEGASKAFPLDALRRVRVLNELLGGRPVLIVHQPTSDTTTAFVARAGGKTLTFEAADAEASALVDHETASRWTAYGECVSGRLKGSTLEPLVLLSLI